LTFKRFFSTCAALTLLIVSSVVGLNVYMNDYGLFGNVKGASIPIYANERTSKYLMSFNYIPANFEGLLIGSSVSNSLNTQKLSPHRVYNGSLEGGNYSELRLIAENVFRKGNSKFLIVCLHPYTSQTHGRRSSFMRPHEYWESLGSLAMIELYRRKLLVHFGKRKAICNDYGAYEKDFSRKNRASKELISARAAAILKEGKKITIDAIAYQELADLLGQARALGIPIFAYYHPYPYDIFEMIKESYQDYRDRMDKLFSNTDVVWDFNTETYFLFRKDYDNYSDEGHLSLKGADFVLKEIKNRLNGR